MRYLLFSILLLSTVATNAQVKFEMGPALSFDYGQNCGQFSWYTPEFHLAANPALLMGVNIKNKVGIHSGFQYTTQVAEEGFSYWQSFTGDNQMVISGKYHTRFLAIPVNISYNFVKKDNRLSAGLVLLTDLSTALSYKYKYEIYTRGELIERNGREKLVGNGDWLDISFNLGAGAFVGYNFSEHINGTFTPYFKSEFTAEGFTYRSFGCTYNLMYRF